MYSKENDINPVNQYNNYNGDYSMTYFKRFLCSLTILTGCVFNANAQQVSFISSCQNITSNNTWNISLADLNGDNFIDAYFDDQIWLNDGTGHFNKTGITFNSTYTAFADLNGDNFADAVSNNIIYYNDGQCNFVDSIRLSSDIAMVDVELADIDNDGDADIISLGENDDRILLNDGNGGFPNTGRNIEDIF